MTDIDETDGGRARPDVPPWLRTTCWLFVPGDRPERFASAARAGAAVMIIDLEASVMPARKDEARDNAARWLSAGDRPDCPVLVRINPEFSPWHGSDLAMLATVAAGCGLGAVQAMAESPAGLARVRAQLPAGQALVPLIESAAGILAAAQLARVAGVGRLAFGNMDYQTDIGSEADVALLWPSSVLVAASRAAGLPAPMAGVTAAFGDASRLAADIAAEKALGFGGKLCIHPAQVAQIRHAFRIAPERLAWAQRVLAAATRSYAEVVDGQLVDRPVIDRARCLLAMAQADRRAGENEP